MINYGTVCSGIGAPEKAIEIAGLDWKCSFMSEIEKFPRDVLRHHFPDHPLHGDFTTIKNGDYNATDVLIGGTPCQDFSVAGKRLGLDAPRGNLALEYLALARRLGCKWLVWENVPGILSSWSDDEIVETGDLYGGERWETVRQRNDFATFLEFVGECGYGYAWHIYDGQYFGVPQRRRRIVLVGYIGDWRPAAAVLFERESLRRDITPSRKAGAGIARSLTSSTGGLCAKEQQHTFIGADGRPLNPLLPNTANTLTAEGFDGMPTADGRGYQVIPHGIPDQAWALQERDAKGSDSNTKDGHLIPLAFSAEMSGTQGEVREDQSPCLRTGGQTAVAFSCKDSGSDAAEELSPTLRSMGHTDSHMNGGGQVAVAFAIQAGAVRENPASGPDGVGVREDDLAYTLEARAEVQAVAFTQNSRDEVRMIGGDGSLAGAIAAEPGMKQQNYIAFESRFVRNGRGAPSDIVPPLKAQSGQTGKGDAAPLIAGAMAVRRLTPRECERLMGFPDDFTLIIRNGKEAADAPRYKALGNSMIVPKMKWILERLDKVHRLKGEIDGEQAKAEKKGVRK